MSQAVTKHFRVRQFEVSASKKGVSVTTDAAGLAAYPFWTPPTEPNICVISLDLDRPAAGLELHTAVVLPHVVVETERGAQGSWLIDRVYAGNGARPGPLSYLEDVAECLRDVLNGDSTVDPLRPSRVRNPAYASLDVRTTARSLSEPWRLGEIRAALVQAGQWPERRRPILPVPERSGLFVGRNDAVNRSTWLTVRRALEAGTVEHWSDDEVLAVARRVNQEIARTEGIPPLPDREVRYTAASITRHQHRPGRRGVTSSQTARELGAKGGSVSSQAKTAAVTRNAAKGHASQSAEAALRAENIRVLAEKGHTHAQIARELGCSTKTVQRALRNC